MPTSEELRIREILAKLTPTLRDELESLQLRVTSTLQGFSSSYVEDAKFYALIVRDYLQLRLQHAQAIEQLSVVQDRCTELKLEIRGLKEQLYQAKS